MNTNLTQPIRDLIGLPFLFIGILFGLGLYCIGTICRVIVGENTDLDLSWFINQSE